MKTLYTLEVLGTESIAVLLLPLKKYKMERQEGVCQVEKSSLSQQHGSLDFYASELKS